MSTYKNKITKLNDSPQFQAMMSLEERERLEHNTEKRLAYEEGISLGIEQGEKQKQLEIAKIAKNLLENDVSTEIVSQSTGLSIEEIENLKNGSPRSSGKEELIFIR